MPTAEARFTGSGHVHTAIDVAYIRAAIACGEWDPEDGARMIAELEAKDEKQENDNGNF